MERIAVESSNVVSVGYDEGSQTLEVEFKGGAVYQYANVPETVHRDLMAASSVGEFLAASIKGTYAHTLMEPARRASAKGAIALEG